MTIENAPKKSPEREPYAYHFESIQKLEGPMKELVGEMRKNIEAGKYDILIGDDASGRIPTWIFYNFLKQVHKTRGLPVPLVHYVAGMNPRAERLMKEKSGKTIADAVEDIQKRDARHPLVVTEFIASGEKLRPLTEALKNKNIPFDIATVRVLENTPTILPTGLGMKRKDRESLRKELGAENLFSGGSGSVPPIYGWYEAAGVKKGSNNGGAPADIYAKPTRLFRLADKRHLQETINQAREDARHLGGELVEWYEKEIAETAGKEVAGHKVA